MPDAMLNVNTTSQYHCMTINLESKEWAQCISYLRSTLDMMYEICRVRQNIFGCEEVLIYLQNATSDFTGLIDTIKIERKWENEENRCHAVSWQVKGSMQKNVVFESQRECMQNIHEFSMQNVLNLVKNGRSKRRKSVDHDDGVQNVKNSKKENTADKSLNNKKSNSSGNCYANVTGGKITAPKCAMDLPQTKASMAKMAYSRLLLWQQRKKQLVEKLIARRRQQQNLSLVNRRRSLPSLTKTQGNDIRENGFDHAKVSKQQMKEKKIDKEEVTNTQLVLSNLESINEEDDGTEDNSSTRTMAGGNTMWNHRHANLGTRSEPPYNLIDELDMKNDAEWRAMTEEEESLAQEEESLKKEIEEEQSVSVDDELQWFVEDHDDLLPGDNSNAKDEEKCQPPSGWRPTWREVVSKWKVRSDSYESDVGLYEDIQNEQVLEQENNRPNVVEVKNSTTTLQYRRPGELAQIRAKMLSPTRKRHVEEKSFDERQQKAEELRQKLLDQKANRLKILHQKIAEVAEKRGEIILRKKQHLERLKEKMSKAEENRLRNINDIVKKAKDEEQRVMEISFINTLDAENIKHEKHEGHARDIGRFQKRVNIIAEERARKIEQKIAKELAVEERRKLAEEKRVEHLRQSRDKKLERLNLAELQRNEMRNELTEKLRNKLREKEHKVEEHRANEMCESQILLNRIQQKHDESVRRHEESLEQVKQKAIDMGSPRPPASWIALADFSQMPWDTKYFTSDKICIRCGVRIKNDLELLAHLFSAQHLEIANVKSQETNYKYFKMELENSIREISDKMDSLISNEENISNEEKMNVDLEFQKQNSTNKLNIKKFKTKLKSKFSRQEKDFKSLNRELIEFLEKDGKIINNIQARPRVYKKVVELANVLKAKKPMAELNLSLERSLIDLLKNYASFHKEEKIEFANFLHSLSLPELMISHCFTMFNPTDSKPSLSSNRIFPKICELVGLAVTENDGVAICLYFSSVLPSMCELFGHVFKICQSEEKLGPISHCISILHLICNWRFNERREKEKSFAFHSSHKGNLLRKLGRERDRLLLNYLCANNLLAFLDVVAGKLSPHDNCNLSSKEIIPLKQTSNLLTSPTNNSNQNLLLYDDKWMMVEYSNDVKLHVFDVITKFMISFLKQSTDIAEVKQEKNPLVEVCASLIIIYARSLYRNFCTINFYESKRPAQHTVENYSALTTSSSSEFSGTMMMNSMYSTCSNGSISIPNEKYSPQLTCIMAHHFISLWNSICASNNANEIFQTMFHVESEELLSLRINYNFQNIVQLCLFEMENCGGNDSEKFKNLLNNTILAIGYFALRNEKVKMVCVLGWRRSLISQICTTLPFEYFSNPSLRNIVIPTLILILFKNPTAISVVRNDFCFSWILSYLENFVEEMKSTNSLSHLIEPNLADMLTFFQNV